MTKLLIILGSLWLLPVTILVWVFYILPGWLSGTLLWDGWHSFLIARFTLKNSASLYASFWRDISGWSGPNVMAVKQNAGGRTQDHEYRHCLQQFLFGPLFYPAYVINSVVIWCIGSLTGEPKHAYLDNCFERDARSYAGQPMFIGRSDWPHGKDDRWPWW